jgi:hypothetical protein
MDHDGIMPANHREQAIINANAHNIRRKLVERAVQTCFTEVQFKEVTVHHIPRSSTAVLATAARQNRPAMWIDEYD